MANVKISGLQKLTTATADTVVPVSEGGSTYGAKPGPLFYAGVANTAGAHNGVGRGIKLPYSIAELSAKVKAADWSNLFIGDYIEVTMTSAYGTETVQWCIAGFDTYWRNGDSSMTTHHLAMVPRHCFNTYHSMNATDTTVGAYVGSKMFTEVLPNYLAAIENAIGAEHILTRREWISKTMTDTVASMAGAGRMGASTACDWTDVRLGLLSEVQACGHHANSSSLYDIGNRNVQLPLFALFQDWKVAGTSSNPSARVFWWLSAVTSSTSFAYVSGNGGSSHWDASSAFGVRPLFLFS